jgi:hypothetical protein
MAEVAVAVGSGDEREWLGSDVGVRRLEDQVYSSSCCWCVGGWDHGCQLLRWGEGSRSW